MVTTASHSQELFGGLYEFSGLESVPGTETSTGATSAVT